MIIFYGIVICEGEREEDQKEKSHRCAEPLKERFAFFKKKPLASLVATKGVL